jgi:broad specificity phosphatase PhoE
MPIDQLILIKHSTSNANPHQPPAEWTLTDEGQQRAHRLTEHLRPYDLTHIVSSTMPKAAHTAAIVAQSLGLNHTQDARLNEHRRENNAPYFDDIANFHAAIARLFAQPHQRVYGDESATEALARFSAGINAVRETHHGHVAVVAHGTVIALLVAAHNPHLDGFDLWGRLALPSYLVLDKHNILITLNADAGS